MPASPAIHTSLLYGFLLVLTRVAGIFTFLPLPGFKAGPDTAKITLAFALTFALYARWPNVVPPSNIVELAGWMLAEAAIGTAIGLAVSFLIEAVVMAAQAISTQAGYSFASTIDPNTEADATVLIVFAQLIGAILFFAMGLDRQLLAILARSFETNPPGVFAVSQPAAEALAMLGSGIFITGLRLALPLMALLFLIDLTVGLLGRLNGQLQLIALAFPAKMLAAVAGLTVLVLLIPKLYQQSAAAAFGVLGKLLGW
ncbi:MAG TPA: flagellar biosynthetic protein FliR [Bryobacteraceae bacterium]|nr:flagellar biosynthetic protein FliR [Bryobacteraceae bacterium]